MLNVTLLTSNKILFEGEASLVRLPGEQGIFEVGLMHKPLVSRLFPGVIRVDKKPFTIRHGVAKIKNDQVIAMVDLEPNPYQNQESDFNE